MARDDFNISTKRTLAQRAGSRCSKPGCDILCWLPGEGSERASSIGVAAHIKAASPDGPRYDLNQTPDQRKHIDNGIYLCQNDAHLIDTSEQRYPVHLLNDWKKRHEEQVSNEVNMTSFLPMLELKKNLGLSYSAEMSHHVTSQTTRDRIEHSLIFTNNSDFEYRMIGFTLQFPELMEHEPIIKGPPGFQYQLDGENMEMQISTSGGGSVTADKRTHYGSFTLQGTGLLQGQSLEILIKSNKDIITRPDENDKIYFWISGETKINIGSVLRSERFSAPLSYEEENRLIRIGKPHSANPDTDPYVSIIRGY